MAPLLTSENQAFWYPGASTLALVLPRAAERSWGWTLSIPSTQTSPTCALGLLAQ